MIISRFNYNYLLKLYLYNFVKTKKNGFLCFSILHEQTTAKARRKSVEQFMGYA